MKKIFFLLISFILVTVLTAQDEKQKQNIEDTFSELESGKLVLRFFDALTGEAIPDADVLIQNSGDFRTDFEGRVNFPPNNENEIVKIKFMHPDYITSEFEIEIMAGTIFFNRFSISPKLPIGAVRIVLDWSDTPKDLDAHFVKENGYHISYRNMRNSTDGIAKLDRDDTDGYGPETITANRIDNTGKYTFYVHDYSNKGRSSSEELSKSKASLKVYGGDNQLLKVFKVPEDLEGDKWQIFTIENGKLR
jgi:hypothetical protein